MFLDINHLEHSSPGVMPSWKMTELSWYNATSCVKNVTIQYWLDFSNYLSLFSNSEGSEQQVLHYESVFHYVPNYHSWIHIIYNVTGGRPWQDKREVW